MMNNKTWKRLLGYEPTKEMKVRILATVQDEKISIEEACGRVAMPPVFIKGVNEPDPEIYDNDFRPAVYIK
jgi:hypothetical protein